MKKTGKRIPILLKVDLPALVAVILFAVLIFLYLLPGFERIMMQRKRILIHEMTSSAYSILEYFHNIENKEVINRDTAQVRALDAINTIRYGEMLKDYFWITDMHPRMLVHPYRPDLIGEDLTDFQDSKGKRIFVEFVSAASETGESYVEYMWQWNDDSTRIVPKLSYVRIFEPWGWVIGTGIYIDDVRSEIKRMELRALFISAIIGSVIVILLSLIARQGHKIEKKRDLAEKELHKSKELYRTLAEAASEGVLIWSSAGLQANKILLSWLDYTESELLEMPLQAVFVADWLKDYNDPEELYTDLTARRYYEGNLKSKNGKLINAYCDFSRIMMGDQNAVLVAIRPVKSTLASPAFSPDHKLLANISTGFFKISYGRKNKFTYASDFTLKLLGFNTLQELLPHSIDTFFADTDQLKELLNVLAGKKQVTGKAVKLKNKQEGLFWALVNININKSDVEGTWYEGTIEPLCSSASILENQLTDLFYYSASFIMDAPVSSIMRQPVVCPENTSVARASSLMKESGTQALIIINNKGEPMGTIDFYTIGLRLAEGGSPQTEIFRWMHSPPLFIDQDSVISIAFNKIHKSPGKCIIISSEDKSIAGIITAPELLESFFATPDIIISEINNSTSVAALRNCFLRSRQLAVSMILGEADPYTVSLMLSLITDEICKKTLSICIEESGVPPCRFAFIHTGSSGRHEPSLSTDQDNAIIFENIGGKELKSAYDYFLSLGRKVNTVLREIGYRECKGGNMAGNPAWCQPVGKWKEYFTKWIKNPGPDELLEVSIFFDFRFCYGDASLPEEIRSYLQNDLKTNDIYFHHLTSALKTFTPSKSILSSDKFDIKKILFPLTGVIRLYALRHQLKALSTPERIIELYSVNKFDINLLKDALRAWKSLTSVRLYHQAICITQNKEPDNIVDNTYTGSSCRYLISQAIETVNNLLLKSGNDFYNESI